MDETGPCAVSAAEPLRGDLANVPLGFDSSTRDYGATKLRCRCDHRSLWPSRRAEPTDAQTRWTGNRIRVVRPRARMNLRSSICASAD
jgi:hypothetical protein